MVNVGIADLNVVKYPDVLATYALGSCVGICLYDHKAKIAGMAHILLPSSWTTFSFSITVPPYMILCMNKFHLL